MTVTNASITLSPHRDILRLAGISAKSDATYFTSCTCGETCGVYTTPENDTWVHCPHCGFSGPSVEYVAMSRRIPMQDMPEWLREHKVKEDEVARMMHAATFTPMLAFRALWARAKRNVHPDYSIQQAFTLMQSKRVYNEWQSIPVGVGVLTVGDIAAVRSEYPGAQLKISNAGAHKAFIATARYDVPGRVCGINLIQSTGESDISSRDRLRNNFTGGLAIDNLAADDNSIVYVFDNQHTALMYQAKCYVGGGSHVRVAVYNFETAPSTWDYLRRATVIYVATDNILEAVNVTRHIPGAEVIRVDAAELEAWILGTSVALLQCLHDSSKVPWPKAARDWLFEKPAVRHDRLRQLALSAADMQRLLEYCTDAERRALSADEPICREIMVEGCVVRETPNGYEAMLDRHMTEIANIRIELSHSVIEKHTSKTWYYGFLVFQGSHLSFVVDHKQLLNRSAFLSWINSMTSAAGLGIPSIRPAWAGKLMTIATMFSTPIIEKTDRLLGWSDATKSLLLPSVVISSANGVQNRAVPLDVGIPEGVWQAATDYMPLLQDSSNRALEYMVFAVAIATSMTSACVGASPYTFVVGATPNMLAVPRELASSLGIPVINYHPSKVIDRRYGAAPAIHGFPVLYQPDPNRVIAAVSRTSPSRSEIIRVGYRTSGFARLFPFTASVQFPIDAGTPNTGRHNYAPQAARLACELTYRVIKDGVSGDVAAAVIRAFAKIAKGADAEEHIHQMLGRILLPPQTDSDWCTKYVAAVKAGVADGWLAPSVLRVQGGVEVVDVSVVSREALARGTPSPHPGAVAERFCAAGISGNVKIGR